MNTYIMKRVGILVGLGWLAMVGGGDQTAFCAERLKIGDPLPALSLPRTDDTPGLYSLELLKDRVAVLIFWRPKQELSLQALRDLQTIVQEIGVDQLHIVAVDASQSSAREAREALAAETFSFPVVLDPQRELYGKMGVIVSPTTYLLDAQGVLQFKMASHPRQYKLVIRSRLRYLLGEIDEEQMKQEIEPTVLKIDQDLAAAWRMYNLGKRLQAEHKTEKAIAIYEQSISQYPSLPEARCALGFMKFEAGDLEAAAQQFQTALTYQPLSPNARLGQAAVLARTGQLDQAEQILLSLLGHKSIAVRTRYELGRVYQLRGELQKAVTFFQDALGAIFPEPKLPSTATPPPQIALMPPQGNLQPSSPRAVAAAPANSAGPGASRLVSTVEAVTPPPDAQFLGVKKCKKCHLQQWKSWKDTKMALAFEVLKPGKGVDVKTIRNLDPRKDYTTDEQCLRCHSNGFGHPGGYRIPPPGDAAAARAAGNNASIGCESCHGPGNKYVPIHKDIQDKRRPYNQSELFNAGQYNVDARVCAACHQQSAPCIGPDYAFDFEQRKKQGTHRHYDLKFRSQ